MAALTEKQAFAALALFLRLYYDQTKSGNLAIIPSNRSLLREDTTADPAAWGDWQNCVAENP